VIERIRWDIEPDEYFVGGIATLLFAANFTSAGSISDIY
jgi:hypothetical protein